MSTRKVNIIQSKADLPFAEENLPHPKRRVAAYARVSTDSEEQLSSYEAQLEFYTHYIQSNPDWEFVGVYADGYAPYGQNAKSP